MVLGPIREDCSAINQTPSDSAENSSIIRAVAVALRTNAGTYVSTQHQTPAQLTQIIAAVFQTAARTWEWSGPICDLRLST